ncbi:MAG: hypothetical protein E3J72_15305 [Planctomycetota bacterium]|nr:MAG: hypothetical protein E3J72_15305 [Planctomycetota bacterium]
MIRALVFWGVAVLVFATGNGLIAHKEHVLKNGQTVLLRLAPRDPRSLMQGDYMVLRYAVARKVANLRDKPDGYLVIKLDENSVAEFVRLHEGGELAEGELLLRYRYRDGLNLGAEGFFFQEGHAKYYNRARYGELKVTPNGNSVLAGLRGKDFEPLGPPQDE